MASISMTTARKRKGVKSAKAGRTLQTVQIYEADGQEVKYGGNPRFSLEMTTIHSDIIRILFETLKEILQDVNIIFTQQGIKITHMDNSQTVLVHLTLVADQIRSDGGYYFCEAPRTVGVNMGTFYKLIKTVSKEDVISFFIDREDKNHLCIKIENKNKNITTVLKYKVYDIDQQEISIIENIDNETIFTMPSSEFQKYVKDMYNLSDVLEITIVGNQVTFSCDGDWASQKTIINSESPPAATDEVIQGKFSLQHLQSFTKATNLCINTNILLKNNFPLIVQYPIPSLGILRFLLSQRENT